MHCHDFLLHLDDLLGDVVAAEAIGEVREHLQNCRRCHVVVNTCRETVRVYRNETLDPLPPALFVRVRDAVRKKSV